MEIIGAIVVFVIGGAILRFILTAGSRTAGAAIKAASGEGTFRENLGRSFTEMGPFETRLVDEYAGENNDISFKSVEVRGLFPINQIRDVSFVTSVLDLTDEEVAPVISPIEAFQEPSTTCYQHLNKIGTIRPDQGFAEWVRVGGVFTSFISPPYSGNRKLSVILRLVNNDDMPIFTAGYCLEDRDGILWQTDLDFNHDFVEKGYREAAEHRAQARALSIQIGMAVAMSDGVLADSEGNLLKEWITRVITPYSDEKQQELKDLYNSSMVEAYKAAQNDNLTLSNLTEKLNEISEISTRYETIELCYDVMAADGVIDTNEIQMIRQIAEALELDFDELEKIRDTRMVRLDVNLSEQSTIEEMLEIHPEWGTDRIKTHLRLEFQKWNNRLNTLEEGTERDNAQRMLELVSDARKKYG